jgi:hypothetical protein
MAALASPGSRWLGTRLGISGLFQVIATTRISGVYLGGGWVGDGLEHREQLLRY